MFVCIHHDNDVVWWRQSGTGAEAAVEWQRWSGGGDGGGGAAAAEQKRWSDGGNGGRLRAEVEWRWCGARWLRILGFGFIMLLGSPCLVASSSLSFLFSFLVH